MSEETPAPTTADPPAKKKPSGKFLNKDGKFHPGPALRRAIIEVFDWLQVGQKPQYRAVSEKHGVKEATLKKCVAMHKKGLIDMGDTPANVEERKLQIANENQRSTDLLVRYESYLNDTFEALLKRAKKEYKEENYLAFDQLGIPKVVAELVKTRNLRNAVEKGNFEALQKLMELHEARQEMIRRGAANGVPSATAATVHFTQNNVTINQPVEPSKNASPSGLAAGLTGTQKNIREILAANRPPIETAATPASP